MPLSSKDLFTGSLMTASEAVEAGDDADKPSFLVKGFFNRTEKAAAEESVELSLRVGESPEAVEATEAELLKVFALNVASTSMSIESLS